MSVTSPEEVLQLLFAALNAGDMEAIAVLYEPGASMIAQPGQVATGIAGVRGSEDLDPGLSHSRAVFIARQKGDSG